MATVTADRSPPVLHRAAPTAAAQPAPAGRRARQNAQNRNALLSAAVEVIGEVGFEGASVARIIARADLSNGTFYLHFNSRQAVLDAVLPFVGDTALNYIRERVRGAGSFLEVERHGVEAFVDYVEAHPNYPRILAEAAIFTPASHRRHMASAQTLFLMSLRRAFRAGELPGYDRADLALLGRILLGARIHLIETLREAGGGPRAKLRLIDGYLRFVRSGLSPESSTAGGARNTGDEWVERAAAVERS